MNRAAIQQSNIENLHARVRGARASSDQLFQIVRPKALYDRPIPERHRIIFYLGHLEAFDWNLLRESLGLTSFDPEFDRLFAFGIDPVEGGLPTDQPSDWPSLNKILRYNAQLRQSLDGALRSVKPNDARVERLDLGRLLEVAIEHRLMHAETLCYMLHQLPVESKLPHRTSPPKASQPHQAHKIDIPAGIASLGQSKAKFETGETFGWDNEFDENQVAVPSFAIDAFDVTNEEYLRFVLDGGYQQRSLWSDAGWDYISSQERAHPIFWIRRGDSWSCRTMFDEVPLPPDWPVYVSHDEASAYARWKGEELPSEAEWHRAACGTRDGRERPFPWGTEQPSSQHGNFDLAHWDPTAVGSYPAGSSDFGVADLSGNGWEWTRTAFGPFPGFEPFPFYPGYSANFFDGKHFVMKGGSPRTAACMLRRSFRNWFQPHYPYVYAKFRCVEH